jgi:hypothetical protein
MAALQIFCFIWQIVNVFGVIAISIACFVNAEFNDSFDIFVYPLLIRSLREKLSALGTTIITLLFSIFFAPAIIIYFVLLFCYSVAVLIINGFMHLFQRRD